MNATSRRPLAAGADARSARPWLAHYPPNVPPTIDEGRLGTLVDIFRTSVATSPSARRWRASASG